MFWDSNSSEYVLSECLEYVLTQNMSKLESQYISVCRSVLLQCVETLIHIFGWVCLEWVSWVCLESWCVWPPKNGEIALWLPTNSLMCSKYIFPQKRNESIDRTNGTMFYPISYCNVRELYSRLKYWYRVISAIVDSLPGNTKNRRIDPFVAFRVRFFHSTGIGGSLYFDQK